MNSGLPVIFSLCSLIKAHPFITQWALVPLLSMCCTTCCKKQVIIFTLPPNTTHLAQPSDKGIFGPLKISWRRNNFQSRNPGRVITRYDFSSLFSLAWIESTTPKNILAGFRVTGVHPLNRKSFDGDHEKASLAEKTGLRYIPLYTPSKFLLQNEIDGLASEEHPHPCSRQRPLIRSLTISTPQLPKSKVPRCSSGPHKQRES